MKEHNTQMKTLLANQGIKCTPKRMDAGSLKGTWRLYDKSQRWTPDLIQRLTDLGFVGHDHNPLSQWSGNGGMFSVFVRKSK